MNLNSDSKILTGKFPYFLRKVKKEASNLMWSLGECRPLFLDENFVWLAIHEIFAYFFFESDRFFQMSLTCHLCSYFIIEIAFPVGEHKYYESIAPIDSILAKKCLANTSLNSFWKPSELLDPIKIQEKLISFFVQEFYSLNTSCAVLEDVFIFKLLKINLSLSSQKSSWHFQGTYHSMIKTPRTIFFNCKIDAFLSWNFLISVSSISSSVLNRNEIISHELFINGTILFLHFLLKVLNEIKSKSCRIFLVLFTIISNRISQFDHYPNQSCMLSKTTRLTCALL